MLSAAAELESQGSLRGSSNPRVLIEMLLLRLSYMDKMVSLEELITALGGVSPPSSSAPGSGTGGGNPGKAKQVEKRKIGDKSGRDSEILFRPQEITDIQNEIIPSDDIQKAWRRWLETGNAVPLGLSGFLRAAKAKELTDGSLELAFLPGPGVRKMREPGVIAQICEGVAPYLTRTPEIVLADVEAELLKDERITEKSVQVDTLRELFQQEPRLGEAVEELDLELMD